MNPISLETLIADQIFKISKSNKDIQDYLTDCESLIYTEQT